MALSDYYQMNYVMNFDKSMRPVGMVKTYEWAKRACHNGVERGCETAESFGQIIKMDLSELHKECE